MAGDWVSVMAKLIPLALVIALSPITVIPAVLVLHAPRPRPTSLTFLGGWVLGLAVLTGAFVGGSDLLGGMHQTTPPTWASWLRVVLGLALIAFGVSRWLTRHRHSTTPAWMRSFSNMTPTRAGVTGTLLGLRPEVLIMCLAAGVAIGTGELGTAAGWICGAVFVVVSASTVAIPILGYIGAGDRLDNALERLKAWMEENHGAMMAVILVLIGLIVLYNGIHALP